MNETHALTVMPRYFAEHPVLDGCRALMGGPAMYSAIAQSEMQA